MFYLKKLSLEYLIIQCIVVENVSSNSSKIEKNLSSFSQKVNSTIFLHVMHVKIEKMCKLIEKQVSIPFLMCSGSLRLSPYNFDMVPRKERRGEYELI